MGRVSVIKSRLPCDQVDRVSKEAPLKKKQWLSGRCLCLLIFLIVFVAIAIAVLVVLEPGNNSQHGLGLVAASKTLISGGWPVRISFFCLFLVSLYIMKTKKPRIPPQKLTNITYDNRAIILNGQRQVLITGAIHYPRSSPEMWPELFRLSKEAGINTIDTYVFWDLHEPVKGEFEFEKG